MSLLDYKVCIVVDHKIMTLRPVAGDRREHSGPAEEPAAGGSCPRRDRGRAGRARGRRDARPGGRGAPRDRVPTGDAVTGGGHRTRRIREDRACRAVPVGCRRAPQHELLHSRGIELRPRPVGERTQAPEPRGRRPPLDLPTGSPGRSPRPWADPAGTGGGSHGLRPLEQNGNNTSKSIKQGECPADGRASGRRARTDQPSR
jgi:hypothetical protein